jgi:hypothetical protein
MVSYLLRGSVIFLQNSGPHCYFAVKFLAGGRFMVFITIFKERRFPEECLSSAGALLVGHCRYAISNTMFAGFVAVASIRNAATSAFCARLGTLISYCWHKRCACWTCVTKTWTGSAAVWRKKWSAPLVATSYP